MSEFNQQRQANTPWYPGLNNQEIYNFVYLQTLIQQPTHTAEWASEKLQNDYDAYGDLTEPLSKLTQLISYEESKEQDYIQQMSKILNQNMAFSNDGELILAMNEIHAIKPLFQRNLKKILDYVDNGGNGQIDITKKFKEFWLIEMERYMKEVDIKRLKQSDIEKIIEKVIDDFYLIEEMDENGDLTQPLMEMWNVLNNNPDLKKEYVQRMYNLYFAGLWSEKSRKGTIAKSHLTKGRVANKSGTAQEIQTYIFSKVKDQFTGKYAVGSQGRNTDTLFTVGFTLPSDTNKNMKDSKRSKNAFTGKAAENVREMRKLQSELLSQQTGYLVEISEKNYNIDGYMFKRNGGFSAGQAMSINQFDQMLVANGFNDRKIDSLITSLVNLGPDTLNTLEHASPEERKERLSRYIASLIGYFIFDDINIIPPNYSTQSVHLFNLMGIYIPLSVFLKAVYNALKSAERTEYQNMVQVYITAPSVDYVSEPGPTLTKAKWQGVFQKAYHNNRIHVNFFKTFAQYIKQHLSGVGY